MLGTTALANLIFAFADTAGVAGHMLVQICLLFLIVPLAVWGRNADVKKHENSMKQVLDKIHDQSVSHQLRERQVLYKMARIYRRRSGAKKRI